MPLYEQGVTGQYNPFAQGVIPDDVFGVAINFFINRTPLTSRLPKQSVGSPQFKITNDNYRPRSIQSAAAFVSSSGSLSVTDGSMFDVGDVIQVESEYMLVTAISGNTLTVSSGYANSTSVNHNNNSTVYLLTNTRTGAEVNQNGLSRIPATVTQYCQTVQHAYSIGGALQAKDNYVSGLGSPLQRDKMLAAQHCFDDFESACYYGVGFSLASTTGRPAMKGLKALLTTNNTTSPTNASQYKPSDLIRDTVQKCFDNGGNPSVMLVSTDFLTGFAIWGNAAMRIMVGENVYGTKIDLFEVPFLTGISIVPAPLLRSGTAICLSEAEVRVRMVRPLFDKERGSRGDAFEGDMIMEGAIEADNEAHHAWVSGITTFSAT